MPARQAFMNPYNRAATTGHEPRQPQDNPAINPSIRDMNRPPLAFPGERIGLMGGSFNPPHEGHVLCAVTALLKLRLDRVWWMVSPGNPLKSPANTADFAHRLAMSRALARDPAIEVTGFEAGLSSPYYTWSTIAFLRQRYPRARFVWVMGADNLATFHRWQHWRRICSMVPIAVVDRPGWRLRALSSAAAHFLADRRLPEAMGALLPGANPPAWVLLSAKLSHASSTAIRDLSVP
jgi:nicotinate-nucleotide adenylyltransferase